MNESAAEPVIAKKPQFGFLADLMVNVDVDAFEAADEQFESLFVDGVDEEN